MLPMAGRLIAELLVGPILLGQYGLADAICMGCVQLPLPLMLLVFLVGLRHTAGQARTPIASYHISFMQTFCQGRDLSMPTTVIGVTCTEGYEIRAEVIHQGSVVS